MKRLILLFASATLLVGSGALADPNHGHGHGDGGGEKHGDQGDYGDRGDGYRRDDGGPPGLRNRPYGLPPGQAKKMWRQGQYMPRTYYEQRRYLIAEPTLYHLRPPPLGYRWVQYGGNAYLVRQSNGVVADVVADALANLVR